MVWVWSSVVGVVFPGCYGVSVVFAVSVVGVVCSVGVVFAARVGVVLTGEVCPLQSVARYTQDVMNMGRASLCYCTSL